MTVSLGATSPTVREHQRVLPGDIHVRVQAGPENRQDSAVH